MSGPITIPVDLNKSAIDNLFSLINKSTQRDIQKTDVNLTYPTLYHSDSDPRNTQIILTATASSKYAGSFTFRYLRNSLEDYALLNEQELPFTVSVMQDDSVETILSFIANNIGVIDNQIEFTTEIEALENFPILTKVKAKQYSYCYIGEIDVILNDGLIDLGVLFADGLLTGFEG